MFLVVNKTCSLLGQTNINQKIIIFRWINVKIFNIKFCSLVELIFLRNYVFILENYLFLFLFTPHFIVFQLCYLNKNKMGMKSKYNQTNDIFLLHSAIAFCSNNYVGGSEGDRLLIIFSLKMSQRFV